MARGRPNTLTISWIWLVAAICSENCLRPLRSDCICQSLAVPNSPPPSTSQPRFCVQALKKLTNFKPLVIFWSLFLVFSRKSARTNWICRVSMCIFHMLEPQMIEKNVFQVGWSTIKIAVLIVPHAACCQISMDGQYVINSLKLKLQWALLSRCHNFFSGLLPSWTSFPASLCRLPSPFLFVL